MQFNNKNSRKWMRILHRDLSFFFAGVIIIYAISGVVMNHRDTINPNFRITKKEFNINTTLPDKESIDQQFIVEVLKPLNEHNNYTKHYFPEEDKLKIFLKGGSNLAVDLKSGNAVYESVTRRYILSSLTKLHYNPGQWWTYFADVFSICLILITLTGLFLVRGKYGLTGRGGVLLVVGLLFPLLFLFFF